MRIHRLMGLLLHLGVFGMRTMLNFIGILCATHENRKICTRGASALAHREFSLNSSKQKLSTISSITAELVGVADCSLKVPCFKEFSEA